MSNIELTDVRYRKDEPEAHGNPAYVDTSSSTGQLDIDNNSIPPPYSSTKSSIADDAFTIEAETHESSTDNNVDDNGEPNCFIRHVVTIQEALDTFFAENNRIIKWLIYAALIILYAAYFSYAMYFSRLATEDDVRLLWVTCLVVLCAVAYLIYSVFGEAIAECTVTCTKRLENKSEFISWIIVTIFFVFILVFVIVDVAVVSKQPYNLVSGAGILIYIALFFIFSAHPAKVKWRPVVWGLAIQFMLAFIILRWDWGFNAFVWMGERISEFLEHTDAGSKFIFGDAFINHFFAFKVLPVVIFFSMFISILYYLGCMQVVIRGIAVAMQTAMGTTAAESLNAAANIFIGQSEAPLLIRPLLHDMTRSELHAVMTGGFATIAGTVMAAYIAIGVPANHLISASVMSAPAALAMAKLFYPETETSKTTADDVKEMGKSTERNIIEAASAGASASISLVANIAANLIAFIALLAFIDATLGWFGDRVGVDGLTFELICSYILWPLAFIMGIDIVDCRKVAGLIGIKTFLNEFVAYDALGVYIKNGEQLGAYLASGNVTVDYMSNGDIFLLDTNSTLVGGFMTTRSEVITTYALCGFANFSSMGIMLGSLGAMAPEKKRVLAEVVFRAMLAGNVACFMTACIAGLLYQGELS